MSDPPQSHALTVTSRVFSRLPWPTRTMTVASADRTCEGAHAYAEWLRFMGAKTIVHHIDHRPPWAGEEPSDAMRDVGQDSANVAMSSQVPRFESGSHPSGAVAEARCVRRHGEAQGGSQSEQGPGLDSRPSLSTGQVADGAA